MAYRGLRSKQGRGKGGPEGTDVTEEPPCPSDQNLPIQPSDDQTVLGKRAHAEDNHSEPDARVGTTAVGILAAMKASEVDPEAGEGEPGVSELEPDAASNEDVTVVEAAEVWEPESLSPVAKKARLEIPASADSSFVVDDSSVAEEASFSENRERRSTRERSRNKEHTYVQDTPTDREMKSINQSMIHAHQTERQYFCYLCAAKLNTVDALVKHLVAVEHERRARVYFNWGKNKHLHPYFCEVCVAACTCESMLDDHMFGKKHAKTVSFIESIQSEDYAPMPMQRLSKILSGPPVEKVGDGMTLGLSQTMMRFFSLPGPFIGLKYAEEIGPEGDPNPRYFCHLCKIHMDCNNVGLHFTSTAHRHTVLNQDYPDRLAEAEPRPANTKKDTERFAKLAAEIESQEGRKVEMIKRKILKKDWHLDSSPSQWVSGGGGRGRGGPDSRGRGALGRGGYEAGATGRGGREEFGRGRTFGQRGGRGEFGGGRTFGQRGGGGRGEFGGGRTFGQRGGGGRGEFGRERKFGQRGEGGQGEFEKGKTFGQTGEGGRAVFGRENTFGQRGGGPGEFGRGARGGRETRGGFGRGERGGGSRDVVSQAYGGFSRYGSSAGSTSGGQGGKTWRELGSSSNSHDSYSNSGSYNDNFRGNRGGSRGNRGRGSRGRGYWMEWSEEPAGKADGSRCSSHNESQWKEETTPTGWSGGMGTGSGGLGTGSGGLGIGSGGMGTGSGGLGIGSGGMGFGSGGLGIGSGGMGTGSSGLGTGSGGMGTERGSGGYSQEYSGSSFSSSPVATAVPRQGSWNQKPSWGSEPRSGSGYQSPGTLPPPPLPTPPRILPPIHLPTPPRVLPPPLPPPSSVSYHTPSSHLPPSHTPSSHLPPSHTPSSHLPPSHTPSSHLPPSHTPSSHLPPSHTPSSHLPPSHTPSSHLPPSHTPSSHLLPSHTPSSHLPPSHTPSSHLPPSHTPSSHLPPSHTPSSHLPPSHTPSSHLPPSHTPSSHLPPSHTPSSHLPPSHTPSSHLPPSHTAPSYLPESRDNSSYLHQQPQHQQQQQQPHQLPGPSGPLDSEVPRAEIFKNLAMSSIESEEDAEMALQLSSTLTQALLAYRIKNVSNTNPLTDVLSMVQSSGLAGHLEPSQSLLPPRPPFPPP